MRKVLIIGATSAIAEAAARIKAGFALWGDVVARAGMKGARERRGRRADGRSRAPTKRAPGCRSGGQASRASSSRGPGPHGSPSPQSQDPMQ